MKIGVPKEIKTKEFRVGMVPAGVRELTKRNHKVIVEKGAGLGIGITDEDYKAVGAEIAPDADAIFECEMIVKVKEPQKQERIKLRKDQILFTYLHLASDLEQTNDLLNSKVTAIAYETVTDSFGRLPLLTPMSEVAGRLSVQIGSYYLLTHNGGLGKLMGGVPGVHPSKVLIIGGGVVGLNATKMAVGLGSDVIVVDKNIDTLRFFDNTFSSQVKTLHSSEENIRAEIKDSDLVIGGVLSKGAKAPKLVTKDMVKTMKKGAVIVDVAIDQGGCFETSTPTTHIHPTYLVDDVIHYCVTNMPGSVPRTSTYALTNATLPYVLKLAENGLNALKTDKGLLEGLNTYNGHLTEFSVARDLELEYTNPNTFLGN